MTIAIMRNGAVRITSAMIETYTSNSLFIIKDTTRSFLLPALAAGPMIEPLYETIGMPSCLYSSILGEYRFLDHWRQTISVNCLWSDKTAPVVIIQKCTNQSNQCNPSESHYKCGSRRDRMYRYDIRVVIAFEYLDQLPADL